MLLLNSGVDFYVSRGAKIIVENGVVHLGYPLPGISPFSTRPRTIIALKPGATLVFKGDTFVAPGNTIRVGTNAVLTFGGKNNIGHDGIFICNQEMSIGYATAFSWNVTLIDDDGHEFLNKDEKPIRRFKSPMIIGESVGIQMNVTIPKGVRIGDQTIISANTVVRRDIPAKCLAYHKLELELKNGIHTNLQ